MKKLSDYKNEEAIELWANILDPVTRIFQDKALKGTGTMAEKASKIMKLHPKEASEIVLAIDPTPITGLNFIARILGLLIEIENAEEFADFFGSAQPEMMVDVSSGSAMENTGADGQ